MSYNLDILQQNSKKSTPITLIPITLPIKKTYKIELDSINKLLSNVINICKIAHKTKYTKYVLYSGITRRSIRTNNDTLKKALKMLINIYDKDFDEYKIINNFKIIYNNIQSVINIIGDLEKYNIKTNEANILYNTGFKCLGYCYILKQNYMESKKIIDDLDNLFEKLLYSYYTYYLIFHTDDYLNGYLHYMKNDIEPLQNINKILEDISQNTNLVFADPKIKYTEINKFVSSLNEGIVNIINIGKTKNYINFNTDKLNVKNKNMLLNLISNVLFHYKTKYYIYLKK